MRRLEGKIAVVTSGGQPIAAGIAVRFAQEGATVVILDGDGVAGARVAAGGDVQFLAAASDDKAALTAAIAEVGERYGRIDALVVGGEDAPGPDRWAPLEQKTDADFAQCLGSDVYGALWAMQAAFPYMKENGGSIICVFSPFGEYASQHVGDHMAGRWGAVGLARTAAHEWGRHQIRVHTLVPMADTPAFRTYRERDPEAVDARIQDTALKRIGDPVRDIGGAAVFLASDDTRFLTGQMVYADGGDFMTAPVFEPVWDS
jgi:3-oxoacyl-[acyl-carrier protein] reductase